jgi:hypothetical protein
MKPVIRRREIEMKADAFRLISLLMRGFLRKETLARKGRLAHWLNAADRVQVFEWGQWMNLVRSPLFSAVIQDIRSTLERPLTESELIFAAACVERFISLHGINRLQEMRQKNQRKDERSFGCRQGTEGNRAPTQRGFAGTLFEKKGEASC